MSNATTPHAQNCVSECLKTLAAAGDKRPEITLGREAGHHPLTCVRIAAGLPSHPNTVRRVLAACERLQGRTGTVASVESRDSEGARNAA